jgi:hypothetical protein
LRTGTWRNGPTKEKEIEGCGKLRTEKFHNLCLLQSTIRMTKLWWVIYVEHAGRMEDTKNVYTILIGNLKQAVHLRDVSANEKVILK